MDPDRRKAPSKHLPVSSRSIPYGRVFGIVALVWAAVLCYLSVKNNFFHEAQSGTYSSSSTTTASLDSVKTSQENGASPQVSISKQVPASLKQTSNSARETQFIEPIELHLSGDVNELTQIAVPTDHTPITVQLVNCSALPSGYQWNFIAINHSHTPWQGRIQILLRGSGTTVHTEVFKLETPLEPQDSVIEDYGRPLHPFVTQQAPQINGGVINEYSYSVSSEAKNSLVP
jgi:hypothetical protein